MVGSSSFETCLSSLLKRCSAAWRIVLKGKNNPPVTDPYIRQWSRILTKSVRPGILDEFIVGVGRCAGTESFGGIRRSMEGNYRGYLAVIAVGC